jgi:hypothetical protein
MHRHKIEKVGATLANLLSPQKPSMTFCRHFKKTDF